MRSKYIKNLVAYVCLLSNSNEFVGTTQRNEWKRDVITKDWLDIVYTVESFRIYTGFEV